MERRKMQLDFETIKTYSAENRVNLVRIDNLKRPGSYEAPAWGNTDFEELVSAVRSARAQNRQIIFSMGAHVIKCGLSPYLIALMKEGYITHIAGNGACSIHDFELAYLGGTSEHVPTAIEDGSFGMWEQTGGWMNEAIKQGAADGLGYGEALGQETLVHPRVLTVTLCALLRDLCRQAEGQTVWVKLQEKRCGLAVAATLPEGGLPPATEQLIKECTRLHEGSLVHSENTIIFTCGQAEKPAAGVRLYAAPTEKELLEDSLSPVWSVFYASSSSSTVSKSPASTIPR